MVKGILCKRVIQQKSGEMNIDLPIVWDNTMVLSIGNLSEKEIAKLYEIELGSTARTERPHLRGTSDGTAHGSGPTTRALLRRR